ncbi:hypothetical protein EJB05_46843, partial [Eragrostis curvula]
MIIPVKIAHLRKIPSVNFLAFLWETLKRFFPTFYLRRKESSFPEFIMDICFRRFMLTKSRYFLSLVPSKISFSTFATAFAILGRGFVI